MRQLLLVAALLAPVETLDWNVQHAVQEQRGTGLEPVMRIATDIGKPANVLALLLGIAVFGGPAGVETARLALLAAAPANLVVEAVKRTVVRPRPDGERKRSNASFPSSHAANAFVLATVFARRWRRWGIVFWLAAALVAFSRVYLNRHFLSDVVVGALIGIASVWIVARLIDLREARQREPAASPPTIEPRC